MTKSTTQDSVSKRQFQFLKGIFLNSGFLPNVFGKLAFCTIVGFVLST